MNRTIDQWFAAYLAALAHGNRPALVEAVGNIYMQFDTLGKAPPEFRSLLILMEEQSENYPDETDREQYASERLTEIADRHAKRFHGDWIEHMPQRWRVLLSDDVFSDVIRRALEDLVGETRQGSDEPPTPDEVIQHIRKSRGLDS